MSQINWKYILIVAVLATVVGGGIFVDQWWQKKISIPSLSRQHSLCLLENEQSSYDIQSYGTEGLATIKIFNKEKPNKIISEFQITGWFDPKYPQSRINVAYILLKLLIITLKIISWNRMPLLSCGDILMTATGKNF